MTRQQAPAKTLAIGLFALTGIVVPGSMASFIDCTDSFWQVACTAELNPENAPERLVRIDNDPTCTVIEGDLILCTT